jgi:SWI/SNF-related matrix-associated actin-dependent regulator of chromatin subfamily A3
MRCMLDIIRQEALLLNKKSVVWCLNPGQQFYVAAVLNVAGIDCKVYHADLPHHQRAELLQTFNDDPNQLMVLICSYYVNSAGSNMQRNCRNAHLFDVPNSDSLLTQAVGRIWRLNQQRTVKVYDYVL